MKEGKGDGEGRRERGRVVAMNMETDGGRDESESRE